MVGENKILAIEWANKFLPDIKEFAQQKNISCIEVSFEQINGNKRKLQVVENGNK